ncbi:hypothetical protein D9611_000607 [Ephemerocybe angulata]|uniref:C2H2-type domain-containing protein n=1 Tax=Ephemerocybe angulata TaxID=980116 RepID=A0A8H5BME0_9AGAR|nr:hypothetical protein D9611_000607 [Tulosesus angulatus]
MLSRGAASARSDDTKTLKSVIVDWITPPNGVLSPPIQRNVKTDRGFFHPRTGELLCPVHLNWSDPKIRRDLASGQLVPSGDLWPRFLFRAFEYNPENPWEGLFRSSLLVSKEWLFFWPVKQVIKTFKFVIWDWQPTALPLSSASLVPPRELYYRQEAPQLTFDSHNLEKAMGEPYLDLPWSDSPYRCSACGKEYALPRYLDSHERNCTANKRDLSQLLEEANQLWEARKRRRLEEKAQISAAPSAGGRNLNSDALVARRNNLTTSSNESESNPAHAQGNISEPVASTSRLSNEHSGIANVFRTADLPPPPRNAVVGESEATSSAVGVALQTDSIAFPLSVREGKQPQNNVAKPVASSSRVATRPAITNDARTTEPTGEREITPFLPQIGAAGESEVAYSIMDKSASGLPLSLRKGKRPRNVPMRFRENETQGSRFPGSPKGAPGCLDLPFGDNPQARDAALELLRARLAGPITPQSANEITAVSTQNPTVESEPDSAGESSQRPPEHNQQLENLLLAASLPVPLPDISSGPSTHSANIADAPLRDVLPALSTSANTTADEAGTSVPLPSNDAPQLAPVRSPWDIFNVRRLYMIPTGSKLSHDPEQGLTLKDLSDRKASTLLPSSSPIRRGILSESPPLYGPFPNKSSFELADWFWNSNGKSILEFKKLINLFKQPDFDISDTTHIDWSNKFQELGANKDDLPSDARLDEQRDEAKQRLLTEQAREVVYKGGFAVDNDDVEDLLKPISLNVVQNAFSDLMESKPFNLIPAIVVDLMHEFEIGVWKRLFIHLLRLLDAFTVPRTGRTLTAELDERFRLIPSFGRDGIRKFGRNVSGMKRRAARDFEDLLQCSITAFESLIPEPHNTNLMKLLYICAQWHALAKLRLHNDLTLALLDYTTTLLGAQMRVFDQDTCAKVPTLELKKEAEARSRREGKASKGAAESDSSRRPASLDMFTIKFHYLGDYVSSIRHFGTTDSYTTEIGELCHRLPKQWYPRTDKRQYEGQMAQIERRQARLARIRAEIEARRASESENGRPRLPLPEPSLDVSYSVGQGTDEIFDLHRMFMMIPGESPSDSYLHNFMHKLKQHLLLRVAECLDFDPEDFSNSAWEAISIENNRLYHHKIMRTSYTTYDLRRTEDIIHVDTPQSNAMLLNAAYNANAQGASEATEHPYLYAKVLGIFHADVTYVGALPDGTRNYTSHRLEFLWVRWYEVISEPAGDFMLDRLRLCPLHSPTALQFIEPADVLRAVHIVPRFSQGRVEDPESVKSRWINNEVYPWNEYCLNRSVKFKHAPTWEDTTDMLQPRFADRDLFMRYQYGMSVGHTYMYGGTFPPPSIPEIPPTFDHRTSYPRKPRRRGRAAPSRSTATTSLADAIPQSSGSTAPLADGIPQPSGSGAQMVREPPTIVDNEQTNQDLGDEGGEGGDDVSDVDDYETCRQDDLYGDEV